MQKYFRFPPSHLGYLLPEPLQAPEPSGADADRPWHPAEEGAFLAEGAVQGNHAGVGNNHTQEERHHKGGRRGGLVRDTCNLCSKAMKMLFSGNLRCLLWMRCAPCCPTGGATSWAETDQRSWTSTSPPWRSPSRSTTTYSTGGGLLTRNRGIINRLDLILIP